MIMGIVQFNSSTLVLGNLFIGMEIWDWDTRAFSFGYKFIRAVDGWMCGIVKRADDDVEGQTRAIISWTFIAFLLLVNLIVGGGG